MSRFDAILLGIRDLRRAPEGFIPLHAPVFNGKERDYVLDTIESTFVSSVGEYVNRFERMLCERTGARHVVACMNGTAALQAALSLAGIGNGDMVLTQALSFVATANAIRHCGAEPVFLDIDRSTMGLSPDALRVFLEEECESLPNGTCRHRATGRRVGACAPMHSFGFACRIEDICRICADWNIPVVEDAAEALGSLYKQRHCGTFGLVGILSFNGNKIVTTGGGGALLTDDENLALRAKHVTTTAKKAHRWEFFHDQVAWNFRLPNLNAALGCAQLEQLDAFVADKRSLAYRYAELFADTPWQFVREPADCQSNYWLCSVLFGNREERDAFLTASNDQGIMTRPAWEPLHTLPGFRNCMHGELPVTLDIAGRLINLPSSVRMRHG